MDVELSIVMPCLNEAETLERCIVKAQAFLARSGVSGEIVIGDNGSTDGSQEIARRAGARVVDVRLRGYGAAIHGAVLQARGRYCIMGDSDDSYDFAHLDVFVAALREGAALVMGNRFEGGIRPGAMPWKNRYIGNPILSHLGRLLFRTPIRDFHCGIRGFSRAAFLAMDLRTTGMEFASEMVIKATLLKLPICEVPTTLDKDGRSRPPHLRPWRDGWRHLRFMLLFSPNWLFLYPGMLMMLSGLVLGGWLLVRPLDLGGLRLSVGTLIYCAMLIEVGFQALWFALLSRAYAVQEGLVPQSARMRLADRLVTLEAGLVAGTAVLALGLGLLFHAVSIWSGAKFGVLNVTEIARVCIASSLAISLGFQSVFCSLLLSTLKLNVRHTPLVAG
ncbi:glycosyltransferase family 2 protein [Acidocella sp.]|uniref:glycosyltransferase family 2 protein n=1 Tax=Acidocella sp. TaxID=50710 RepID=UPI0026170A50|nr:glycosyltransferase family 2 protein [Acidocella sp.]